MKNISRGFMWTVVTVVVVAGVVCGLATCASPTGNNDSSDATATITHFRFLAAANSGLDTDVEGDVQGKTIVATVPYATDRFVLVPSITHTGTTVVPATERQYNFTNPALYVVIAADGSTTEYTVTVPIGNPPSTVPVFRTGQTTMYLAGDDGDFEAGRAWPAVRFTNHGDGTITDHMTGLMWQQAPDDSVKTWDVALSDANGSTIAGYTDWRLPNILEIASLLTYDITWTNQWTWLQSVGFTDATHSDYWWSSTTNATRDSFATNADFANTMIRASSKGISQRAIFVRGVSSVIPQTGAGAIDGYTRVIGEDGDLETGVPWPDPRFTNNGDNTVTDHLTGLVWEQSVSTGGVDLEQALAAADIFPDGGHTDWRLPNVRELITLIHFGEPGWDAWLNSVGFSDVSAVGIYWSSTRAPTGAADSSGLSFRIPNSSTWGGIESFDITGESCASWPVRGGE